MHTRLFTAVLLAASAALAQTSIIRGDSLDCFGNAYGATATRIEVDGPGFTRAWRITSEMSSNPWDRRVRCYSVEPVRANDVILATFWMRTVSSTHGYGLTTFVVEENVPPSYAKPATLTAVARSEWKRFQVPFVMPKDYLIAPTNVPYNLSFWVTFDPQTIEIGGITVDNYGPGKTLSELGFTYEGHEADAPWRKEAAERIEKIRKSDIVVVAKDTEGRPLTNVPVKVRMKRHAFGFGTAINTEKLTTDARYQQELRGNFNKVVFENHLKWGPFETWDRSMLDASFAWLQANGFREIRGHNVIWPGLDFLPDSVDMLVNNKDAAGLGAAIDARFNAVMEYTKGKVTEWDVLNEPYNNKDVQAVLGDEEMAFWFKKARAIDPNVKLYINDFSILSSGGWDLQHQNGYFDIIKFILDNGGPIDGIGFQSHFNVNVTPPTRVLEILDRFATFGKDLQVTEFDLDIADEQIQADYTRDFLTATFSHPAVKGFVMWGFWAGAHWLPRGAMFTQDWQSRPNHQVWRDLVYSQWWTDVDGVTGDDGVFRTRGFLGDYEVEVGSGEAKMPLTVEAGKPNFVHVGKQTAGRIDAVTNAAGYIAGRVAPGEIVVIWGTGFGPASIALPLYDDGWERFSGNVRVLFEGVAAPLIYAAKGQVAAIVPYSVAGTTRLQIEYEGTLTNAIDVPVAAAVPGIFTRNMQGTGTVAGAVLQPGNTAWAIIDDTVKVRKGAYVSLYITGEGQVTPAVVDGEAPGAPYPTPVLPVSVTFGGAQSACPSNWAGLVYAGVTQINACVPEGAPSGSGVSVTVKVGGVQAQSGATIPIE